MTDYDFHRKIAALEKRIARLENGYQELDTMLDPEGWVGEAFKLLDQDIEDLKTEFKDMNSKIDIILRHITGLNQDLSDLEKQVLSRTKEPLSIENEGKLVGYYYPVIAHQQVKKTKEELDTIMNRVLAETGLTEEQYLAIFMGAEERLCA